MLSAVSGEGATYFITRHDNRQTIVALTRNYHSHPYSLSIIFYLPSLILTQSLFSVLWKKNPHISNYYSLWPTCITTWSFDWRCRLSRLTTEREHNISAESILTAACARQDTQRRYRLWRWQFKVFKVIQTQEEWRVSYIGRRQSV